MKRLVKEKKNVVVIALSQDEGDAEKLGDVRKLVEKTLSEKGIEIEQPPVGFIALDPESVTVQTLQSARASRRW